MSILLHHINGSYTGNGTARATMFLIDIVELQRLQKKAVNNHFENYKIIKK
jgi:hypothetical protein